MKRVVLLVFAFVRLVQFACATSAQALFELGGEQQKFAVYTPQPQYPPEALTRNISGSGAFVIRVHVKTGRVVSVWASQSTGSSVLDAAAIRALSRWRFKPGALTPIGIIAPQRHDAFGKEDALLKVPITFAL
jgi:TonB family protein